MYNPNLNNKRHWQIDVNGLNWIGIYIPIIFGIVITWLTIISWIAKLADEFVYVFWLYIYTYTQYVYIYTHTHNVAGFPF